MSAGRVYGCLRGELWYRPDFAALSANTRLCYLFAFSHRDGNAAGVFRLPALFVAHDVKLSVADVESAFLELEATGWLVRSGDWIALPRLMEHDPPPNRCAAIGAARAVIRATEIAPGLNLRALLPVLHGLLERFREEVIANAVDVISEGSTDIVDTVSDGVSTVPHHNHNQDHYQDQHHNHAHDATETGKTGCFLSIPAADPENKTPVLQEQDDLSLEVAQISDPTLRALDSPARRAAWRAESNNSETYTRFLIRACVEGQHHTTPKENTA